VKCKNGAWDSESYGCYSATCNPETLAPVNGDVFCDTDESCSISCRSGYVLTDDSYSRRKCDGTPIGSMERDARLYMSGRSVTPQPSDDSTQADVTTQPSSGQSTVSTTTQGSKPSGNGPFDKCVVDRGNHFMIKLQSASTNGNQTCLTNSSDGSKTSKATCKKNDVTLYWKWHNNHKLQHVNTGKCLSVDSSNHEVVLSTCTNSTEDWTCSDNSNPYHIFSVADPTRYLDAGAVNFAKPARMRSTDNFYPSGKWFGIDSKEPLLASVNGVRKSWPSTVCSHKTTAVCPDLTLGPYTTVSPSGCGSSAQVGDSCTVTCNSDHSISPAGHTTLTCKSNGLWDRPVPSCVYKDTTNACPSLSLDRNTVASPAYCNSKDSVMKGGNCHFSCKDGYVLHGASSASCNGTWSAAAPSCKRRGRVYAVMLQWLRDIICPR